MTRPVDLPRRLPAGALLLVVVVSLIIGAILLSLLLLTSSRRLLTQRDERRQALQRTLSSGLAYAQAHDDLPYLRPQVQDLFGEGTDSVTIEKKPWGVFNVAVIVATKGRLSDTVTALLGSQFVPENQAALYLAGGNVPLSVNGDAQVRGSAYLPQAEPARDANLLLTGPRRTGPPVTSRLLASGDILPVRDSALTRLRTYAHLQLGSLLPAGIQPAGTVRSQHTSFAGSPTLFYQAEALNLAGLTLAGQVVIASSRRLVVEATTRLDNVLLVAPVVVVKPGFRGRIQIIARDTADLQAGCELLYPSAVCAFSAVGPSQVLLGKGSRISGVVVAAQPSGTDQFCGIRMDASVAIEGQVYSAGIVENCGSVHGVVMCRRLLYRTRAKFYENYLVNAALDRPALPAAFLTSPLLNAGAPSGIMAWLH